MDVAWQATRSDICVAGRDESPFAKRSRSRSGLEAEIVANNPAPDIAR
jgi:hypothetical protein